AEALNEQTTSSRPIKELMVYPPNTPTTLVPEELHQRGSLKGKGVVNKPRNAISSRSFHFLKEHFKGIQKDLTKEVKEMKEIFKELEAQVDQSVVNRKYDEIEQKNLLIANDNLIIDCLSKDMFYTATDSSLTIFRFSNMHEAFNAAQKRISKLKSVKSNLKNRIQNDDHDFFIIGKLKDHVQSKGNTIRELREKISLLTKKHSDVDPIHDLKALDSHNKELHAKVNALHDLNERWRAENGTFKLHYKELNNREVYLDYLKHLKESIETLREIVEEAKVEKPLDSSLAYACLYTKHS
nr:hypothetical protein [Tanacetum cinerariifolium]